VIMVRGAVNQGARYQDVTGLTVEVSMIDDAGQVHWTTVGQGGYNENVLSGTMSLPSFMRRFAVQVGNVSRQPQRRAA
jgi:hypothetical protein